MKKPSISAVKIAGAGALALLLAASAFAEGRPQDRTWRDGDRRETRGDRREDDRRSDGYDQRGGPYGHQQQRQYRDNERVQMNGRIRSYSRERGGYRLWLDAVPYAFWVPEARWRNDWRVGLSIGLGGIFRGGTIYIDGGRDPYYDRGRYDRYDDYVTGYVERVDYRRGTMVIRDGRYGRSIAVDMRYSDDRRSRLDFRDIRRGDRVTLVGRWDRRDVFVADVIDSIDSGRY